MRNRFLRNFFPAFLVLAFSAATAGAARIMWSETGPDAARPTVERDPVELLMRREMLSQLPELHQKPAPFLRIEIPDPLENSRLMGLREQPPDNDPPVLTTSAPPAPISPAAPPTVPAKP